MRLLSILRGLKLSKPETKTLQVPILARVEGEGALRLDICGDTLEGVQLQIYEPPRLFEKFLEGRSYTEILDMVARICGICPVAYQMSATQAVEQCFAIEPTPWVRAMRRLFYCGEWIESHSLHIHFLAAPDFLGFPTALAMAAVYPELFHRGLRLQSLGHEIISFLGARAVHPVGACIGGFYKAPTQTRARELLVRLKAHHADCEALVEWTASMSLGEHVHDFTAASLRHPDEYPMNEGRIVSSAGLDIAKECFGDFFKEAQVPYSTALHCLHEGKPYLVGPLARMNNNADRLPPAIQNLLQRLGVHFPSQNMAHSIIARAVEIYYAVLEATAILETYTAPQESSPKITPRAGEGFGCTEAPRGLLWHYFALDDAGRALSTRIVPPTSQNQARIEEDLRLSLQQFGLSRPDDELRAFSEMIIRNYDPCISCSTHFLKLSVARS